MEMLVNFLAFYQFLFIWRCYCYVPIICQLFEDSMFFQSFSCWFVVAGLWVCQVKQVRSQGDLILYQLKDVLIFSNNCFYFEMFSLIVQNFLSIDINLFVTVCFRIHCCTKFCAKKHQNIKIEKIKVSM